MKALLQLSARDLFSVEGRVTRAQYLQVGVLFMAFKYLVDVVVIYLSASEFWHPLAYFSPLVSTRESLLDGNLEWVYIGLVVWALPFLWVGLTMTVKRARDAGRSPMLGLLFLVPVFNLLTIGYLSVAPTSTVDTRYDPSGSPVAAPMSRVTAALLGSALGVLIAAAMTLISVLLLQEYGMVVFVSTPAIMGAVASWFYNRAADRGLAGSLGVTALTMCISAGCLLAFALEGVICLLMAMPLVLVLGCIGGVIGRAIARSGHAAMKQMLVLCLTLPLAAAAESQLPRDLQEREVISSVIVNAPPAAVWPNVVGFSELDAPPAWIYEIGVAYPIRARIEGEGVGAVRHCEFSTGAFVEPITAWDAPYRLSFDVESQPVPMHEWSPYRHVHPPHLDGYLRSHRGEFRLIDLGDGRTRLEGSTWYTVDLAPASYWSLWSDALIHGIHTRVLAHVAELSESGHASVPSAVLDVQRQRVE
ncbi:MAG: uncharacterized membrane protein YhaH (DUF805 family) [Flavobacteriales bacterium]|jgi:uncharacterized membrane protein YhaH (DUF805 family)